MSIHHQFLEDLKPFQAQFLKATGKTLQLPPPSMLELKLEYLEVVPGISLKAKLPFQRRFTNPIGFYQGGFLAAAIDDMFGPLSYLTANRPTLTLSLNVTYLKPFSEELGHLILEAVVLQKTRNFIFMRTEVRSPAGDLMAHAESHVNIVNDENLRNK